MPRFAAAYSGWSSMVSNKTIGMPITEDMPTSSYHEYIIPAGNPITVQMQKTYKRRLTFTPEAGSDYETYFISKFKGYDELVVNKLIVNADGSITKKKEMRGNFEWCSRGPLLWRERW